MIWRFRWKGVLPIVVSLVVLAFIAGPRTCRRFVTYIRTAVATGAGVWVGNASAQSFSWFVDDSGRGTCRICRSAVLLAVPMALFSLDGRAALAPS